MTLHELIHELEKLEPQNSENTVVFEVDGLGYARVDAVKIEEVNDKMVILLDADQLFS